MPWVMKCPKCDSDISKEDPMDLWVCWKCGWARKDRM